MLTIPMNMVLFGPIMALGPLMRWPVSLETRIRFLTLLLMETKILNRMTPAIPFPMTRLGMRA